MALLFFAACSSEDRQHARAEEEHLATQHNIKYTCPMHPQVVQQSPGKCPICGMDLVPVGSTDDTSLDLMLTESQIALANITIQRVTNEAVGQTVVVNGRMTVDESKSEVISSRVPGRLEKLFIKETGQQVKLGQPLYTLYSEELLTMQQEYLLAKEQYEKLGKSAPRYKSFLDAADRKLKLYGLTSHQIERLENITSLMPRVTFLAPASGLVTEINAKEGQYVSEGSMLYKIEDISTLWVEAELYPGEIPYVKIGDTVNIQVAGIARALKAPVTFLSPEFRNNTQITSMRATVSNPENRLKPGQHAQVTLTHSSRQAIAVPPDALIRDANGSHVYLQTGRNTFRPQKVETGIEGFDKIEIKKGINEGDTVAVTGAYLLYSEFVLKKGMVGEIGF